MSKKLSKNFNSDEFRCRDGSEHEIDPKLIEVLQAIRDSFGKPVTINSGYRSPAYNKKIGGAPKSQHMLGKAADIAIKGVSPQRVYKEAERILALMNIPGGLGLYSGFVHVDTRPNRSRWKY